MIIVLSLYQRSNLVKWRATMKNDMLGLVHINRGASQQSVDHVRVLVFNRNTQRRLCNVRIKGGISDLTIFYFRADII